MEDDKIEGVRVVVEEKDLLPPDGGAYTHSFRSWLNWCKIK